jgi:tetratricopeptide (TPR) repeat protein
MGGLCYKTKQSGRLKTGCVPILGKLRGAQRDMTVWANNTLPCAHLACCLLLMVAAAATGCRMLGHDRSQAVAHCRDLTLRGMAAMEQGDLATAELLLRQALATCNDNPEVLSGFAELLSRRGDPQGALVHLDAAISQSPHNTLLLRRRAELLLALGRISDARATAEKALDLEPRSVDCWVLMGRVYEQANQPRQAAACWHRALGLAPEHRGVLAALANLYWRQREPQRCISYLYALLQTYPPHEEPAELHFQIGQCYAALRRPLEASESFTLARNRGLVKAELFAALAEAQLEVGRLAQARNAAEQALALNPEDQQARHVWQRLADSGRGESHVR